MLQLVLGSSGHGKTEYLYKTVRKRIEERKDTVYYIVPDQLSFTAEKKFLELLGPKSASMVKVLSFNKLSEEIFRLFGGIKEKPLSETGKYVVLSEAIKNSSGELKVYLKAGDKLLKLMADAIDEFKQNLILPKDIKEAEKLASGNLKAKLFDISLIYSIYDALIEDKYIDESDVLTRAAEIMYDKSFAEGTLVIIDGFESFNRQKLKLISALLKKAELCCVSLTTDSAHVSDESLFEPVSKTLMDIRRIARDENVSELVPVYFKDAVRFKNDELKFLENNLFRPKAWEYDKEPENISIYEGLTVYDEAEYIASTIRNLIIFNNYRYDDFAIVAKDPGKYYPILSPVFDKWEIPYYYQEPVRLDSRPLIRLLKAVFGIYKRGFRTEEVLSLLKTGLTEFTSDEISMLENYIYLWKIDGKAWKSDFFKHPKGFGYTFDEDAEGKINELNRIRRSIVEPIIYFTENYREGKASYISEGIYNLLTALKADAMLKESFNKYMDIGMPDIAKEGIHSWQKLMDILDEFALTFQDSSLSLDEYISVLRDVVSKAETRDIPMRMDTVSISSTDVYKPESVKVCFIIGAVQGEIPYIPSDKGIFTSDERSALVSYDLNMESRLEERIKSERFLTYQAAVSPSEKLFVSYHLFSGDEDSVPGRLVTDIKNIFPLIKTVKKTGLSYSIGTYAGAFAAFASLYNENSKERESLYRLLSENALYKQKLEALDIIGKRKAFSIEDKSLSEKMFSEPYFSASQVESYHRCAFSYFLKYGLNIKEKRTAEIDNLEYGTIMHYLFEAILKSDFRSYVNDREKLTSDVKKLIDDYTREKIGGENTLSPRDKYRFNRLIRSAVSMIERFIEELSVSRFEPTFFELYLSDYSDYPPLKIKTQSGKTVSVGGIADRIDVYNSEKGKFVRVIDYKTGTKEFKYSDVLFGLNLQMLIYLAAMSEKGNVIPSGILYLPSSVPEISASKNTDAEVVRKEIDKKLVSSGIVLDDAEIVDAMEIGAAGRFIPTGIKENGSFTKPQNVINEKGFEVLFKHTKNLIKTMAENLINGDIPAEPMMVNHNSCTYCPYGSVCGNIKEERSVNKLNLSKDEVLAEMELINKKGDENA